MMARLVALLLLGATAAHAELLFQLHDNTALSGGASPAPVPALGAASARLGAFQSATLQGQLRVKPRAGGR